MSMLQTPTPDTRHNGRAGAAAPPRRRPRRLARGHWIAIAAGVCAALVNVAVLRDRTETVSVAVAAEPIASGAEVTGDMVRYVEVPADSALVDELVARAAVGGSIATRPVAVGEPLTTQALAHDVAAEGLRSMSIPIAREHAVAGALQVGDRVDVIDVVDDEAVYVVSGAEVLGVNARSGDTPIGGQPSEFSVTVALGDAEALAVAAALADDKLEVVRSTGAAPPADSSTDEQAGG